MANEILDDINYDANKDYKKHLKGIKKFLGASILIGITFFSVTIFYSPPAFERAANLPRGWAEPIVLGALGFAGFLMLIVLFKAYRYWSAKQKHYN